MPIQAIKIKEYRYLDILINFQDEGSVKKEIAIYNKEMIK